MKIMAKIQTKGETFYFKLPEDFLVAAERAIKKTEVVVDIGCGIVPMNYFRPKLHLMVEPWKEYSDILTYRHSGDKSVIIMRTCALEALNQLADSSVDSIFLLDVIEHLEKEDGRKVIIESERVAREQIVIFTPLGFMPQHMESNQTDGWGLSGSSVQEHLSGWEPKDFNAAWSFYICKDFHSVDFKGEKLDKPYGAFYAVLNFENKMIKIPQKMSDIRKPLPSEIEIQNLTINYERKLATVNEECERQRVIAEKYYKLSQMRVVRLILWIKKILGIAHA